MRASAGAARPPEQRRLCALLTHVSVMDAKKRMLRGATGATAATGRTMDSSEGAAEAAAAARGAASECSSDEEAASMDVGATARVRRELTPASVAVDRRASCMTSADQSGTGGWREERAATCSG